MEVLKDIRTWANQRGIGEADSLMPQCLKLMEEGGEIAECIAKGKIKELEGEIGDAGIVLTILAQQAGLTIEQCINKAFDKIKDRKGVVKDGIFVKEKTFNK